MRKLILTEELARLQEAGGPQSPMPDFTRMGRKWEPVTLGDDFPYDDTMEGGPHNAQGRGMRGIGRGGVGWGGRPDDSGGIRQPSMQNTWDGGPQGVDELDEITGDFEQEHQHNKGQNQRNLWRDTPEAEDLRKKVKGQLQAESSWAIAEAMGSPTQIGPVAPMDGPVAHNGRSAKPVKDVNGNDVDDVYIPPPVNPNLGPGNMIGQTVPGATPGWARSPAKNLRESNTMKMRLREFFSPETEDAEGIDNPDQENVGDATDDEIEVGEPDMNDDGNDQEGDEGNERNDAIPGQMASAVGDDEDAEEFDMDGAIDAIGGIELGGGDDEDVMDIGGHMGGADIGGSADADGIDDLMSTMADTEPGDGDDLGGPENIVMMPHAGHGTDFTMSPDRMGQSHGTMGLKSDGAGNSEVSKTSAWDVLHKVVKSLGEEEEQENPIFGDELQ